MLRKTAAVVFIAFLVVGISAVSSGFSGVAPLEDSPESSWGEFIGSECMDVLSLTSEARLALGVISVGFDEVEGQPVLDLWFDQGMPKVPLTEPVGVASPDGSPVEVLYRLSKDGQTICIVSVDSVPIQPVRPAYGRKG